MAKFNIEVELNWADEEMLDDVLKEEIIQGIQDRLTKKIEKEVTEKLSQELTEKVSIAVDEFLKNVTAEKITEIKIPYKASSWGAKVEMIPITEFIGMKFEQMANEQNLDGSGKEYRRYDSKSGPYSLIEYLTRDYIAKELNEKVIAMIQQAKTRAEQTLIRSLEQNLQQQLNADMLKRLNIPELFRQMQNTILIEGEADNGK